MRIEQICRNVDTQQASLIKLSDFIWKNPEDSLREVKAAVALSDYLRGNGFQIKSGLAGMETAFQAIWGEGKPEIAFLGEYDALPGLGQEARPQFAPIDESFGHGCGHNLLGVGAAGAAVALKRSLETSGMRGTVVFVGCPAEEIMEGKIRLGKAGIFDGFDAALTWHPNFVNMTSEFCYQAMKSVRFSFYGRPSHAALAPEEGRSALDAVELMNVGVNYLREHMIPGARVHYTITDGGDKPNIVPAFARSWYYIRAPRTDQEEEIYRRVKKIAQGAALMTDTSVTEEVLSECPHTRLNRTLNKVMQQALEAVGAPEWGCDELEFAERIKHTFSEEQIEGQLEVTQAQERNLSDRALDDSISPLTGRCLYLGASSDVSFVSHIVPTAQVMTCCYPVGTAGHTWAVTACAGAGVGHKGMITAAKILAAAGWRLFEKPEILECAKGEFEKV